MEDWESGSGLRFPDDHLAPLSFSSQDFIWYTKISHNYTGTSILPPHVLASGPKPCGGNTILKLHPLRSSVMKGKRNLFAINRILIIYSIPDSRSSIKYPDFSEKPLPAYNFASFSRSSVILPRSRNGEGSQ